MLHIFTNAGAYLGNHPNEGIDPIEFCNRGDVFGVIAAALPVEGIVTWDGDEQEIVITGTKEGVTNADLASIVAAQYDLLEALLLVVRIAAAGWGLAGFADQIVDHFNAELADGAPTDLSAIDTGVQRFKELRTQIAEAIGETRIAGTLQP